MPKLIYDVEFKIDQASISGLKNIVDASTTGEVTKLTEKIERLEAQLDRLKGTNQNLSKSTKNYVNQSNQKTAAVKRDEAIVKRALQTNQLHTKSVQDAVKRLQQETVALDGLSGEMTQASVSTKRSASSQATLAKQAASTAATITRATGTLQQFNQQVQRSQKGFKGSNKEFAIANQTLFGFGDLAQDATQFSQGFAQGMRAIGNNIAFNAELFGTLKTRTGSYMGAFKALGASFTGVGGAILAVNVAVMLATTLLTKFGNKTKAVSDTFKEFAKDVASLREASDQDFLGINQMQSELEQLEQLKDTVVGLQKEEERLLDQTKAYSSYVETDAKSSLTNFREEHKSLLKTGVKPLDKAIEEINEKLGAQRELIRLTPLGRFRNEVAQSSDILINRFNAGLFDSSSALQIQADIIRDNISALRDASAQLNAGIAAEDINILRKLGLDSPEEIATQINFLKDELLSLEDLFPPDKPVVENIIPEDIVIQEDMSKLESYIATAMANIKADMDATFKEPFAGSLAAEQEKLKTLQQTFTQVTLEEDRKRLRSQIQTQQARIKAIREGIAEEMTLQDLTGDFDPFAIDIVGEDDLLKSQTKELQDALTQITKDGVSSRLNEINREIDADKKAAKEVELAEKAKQQARELGIQGAQAASQLLQSVFGESKEIAIAEALISTYFAAQKAFESQFLPVPTPDSPVRGTVAAGIAIAQGLSRVAAIRSTSLGGGGGAGSGGRSGGVGSYGVGANTRFLPTSQQPEGESFRAFGESVNFTPKSPSFKLSENIIVEQNVKGKDLALVVRAGNKELKSSQVIG